MSGNGVALRRRATHKMKLLYVSGRTNKTEEQGGFYAGNF